MTNLLLVVKMIFDNVWLLFTSINIPGTNISAAMMLIGVFLISFSLKILSNVFDLSLGGIFGSKNGQNGGNNGKIKIESNRKGDSK